MPLEPHSYFDPAPKSSSLLWRYMNLPKFLSLIQTSSLHFFNLELMARDDPFEGALPSSRFRHRKWESIDDIPTHIKDKLPNYLPKGETDLEVGFKKFIDLAELRIRQAYAYRRSLFISCWHLNDYESSAMWDIYSRRNEGIAIVSTEDSLYKAFATYPQPIYGGCVHYEEYSNEEFIMDDSAVFTPLLYKRLSFSYESEYRLVYWDTSVTNKQISAKDGFFYWKGSRFRDQTGKDVVFVGREEEEIEQMTPRASHYISCDTNRLIEKIYISPIAEDWFTDVIISACQAYGLKAPVLKSEIMTSPLR